MSPRRQPDLPAVMDAPGGPWAVEVRRGSAADLHAASADSISGPTVRRVVVREVDGPALVLGSTQPAEVLRPEVRAAAEAGTGPAVVRRRSGGGLVPLAPGAQLWVDVVVPAGDPCWSDDAAHSAGRAGSWWSDAFRRLGTAPELVRTSDEPADRPGDGTALGRVVCFAGTGPGEVELCTDAGTWRKSVGLSQRRTRHGAVLQCLVPRQWDHDAVVDALDPAVVGPDTVAALRGALRAGASPGLGDQVDAVLLAFLAELATR